MALVPGLLFRTLLDVLSARAAGELVLSTSLESPRRDDPAKLTSGDEAIFDGLRCFEKGVLGDELDALAGLAIKLKRVFCLSPSLDFCLGGILLCGGGGASATIELMS